VVKSIVIFPFININYVEQQSMDKKSEKGNEKSVVKDLTEESSEQASVPELERLRQQLEAKEIEAKENYDRFLRQVAEVENLKKRMAREKTEAIRYANESLIRDLLPILDNLERAVDHAKGGNGKPLQEGVEMVLKGLLDVLNKHGVTQISAKGESFDPEKHEAIAQVESEEHEPNTVVEEHHKGYFLLDRLLRPSLVSVAKPPKTKGERGEDGVEKGQEDD
jgi:molecular chaperone GrpE